MEVALCLDGAREDFGGAAWRALWRCGWRTWGAVFGKRWTYGVFTWGGLRLFRYWLWSSSMEDHTDSKRVLVGLWHKL